MTRRVTQGAILAILMIVGVAGVWAQQRIYGTNSSGQAIPIQVASDGSVKFALTITAFEFEGATDDANETSLTATDPTADRTVTLPDASGTVAYIVRTVEANTGTKTPTAAESGEVYTNTGDANGSAVTLPNDPTAGLTYDVAVTVAQTITITANTGETLYLGADPCAVSLTSNVIGSAVTLTAVSGGAGAAWFASGAEGTWVCND